MVAPLSFHRFHKLTLAGAPSFAALALLLILSTSAPARADDSIYHQAAKLLMPYSVLSTSAEGQAILNESMQTTIAIQNGEGMTADQLTTRRAQAMIDASGSWDLAPTTANALGNTFQQIYWTAITNSATTTLTTGSVYLLFNNANDAVGDLATSNKYYFSGTAEHHAPVGTIPYATYNGVSGTSNVYTYYSPGATYANDNPRPLQLWPYFSGTTNVIQQYYSSTFTPPSPGVTASTTGPVSPNYSGSDVSDPESLGPAFPSGHTTFGTDSTILYAMMVPELYQNAMLRESTFGESRIYMGYHHTLDVIGGRIVGTYGTVAWLKDPANWNSLNQQATPEFRTLLMNGSPATFQNTVATTGAVSQSTLAQNQSDYAYRMTYGLSALNPAGFDTGGDSSGGMPYTDAAILLTSRFPYFVPTNYDSSTGGATLPEIADIITSTLNPTDGPLDNPLYGGAYANWSKINLFTAAGGYGALTSDVTVTMNAANAPSASNPTYNPLWANDTWSNNIGGTHTLTKTEVANPGLAPTRLTLSGNNTFAGVRANSGELVLTGSNAFSSDSSVANGGTLVIAGGGSLQSGGDLTIASGGTLAVVFAQSNVVRAGINDGKFTNDGTVVLYTDPSVAGGATMQPVSSPSALAGSGSYRVMGGQWNPSTSSVTVSAISQGETSGSTGTLEDFALDGQRVGFAFGSADTDVMVILLDDASPATYDLTVTDLTAGNALPFINGQSVQAAFAFDTTLGEDTAFLSFNVGADFDISELMLWAWTDNSWQLFNPAVFNYTGDFYSFAPGEFGSYAITAVPEPDTVGLLGLATIVFVVSYRRDRRISSASRPRVLS